MIEILGYKKLLDLWDLGCGNKGVCGIAALAVAIKMLKYIY